MQRLFTLLLASLLLLGAWAVPAKRTPRVVTQADGTQLTIVQIGDEHFHTYLTLDGIPVKRASDGSFYYARLAGESLVATKQLAHHEGLRSEAELAFIAREVAPQAEVQALAAKMTAQRLALREAAMPAKLKIKRTASRVGQGVGATGKKKCIVVLADFQDVKFYGKHTREKFYDYMNKEGYSENGNNGSVRDYFLRQSYGQLDITFDVAGPYTVSGNMADYGANDTQGYDLNPEKMVKEACRQADADVDFSDYDWDGDGEVDQIYVIYAGYGEAFPYSDENTIWPHMSYLGSYFPSIFCDGVKLNSYACSSELYGIEGYPTTPVMDGIGTPCHEFSHCMGLPDFYDTAGYNFGMSYWSIMDTGCYAGDGYDPVGYTSYERMFSGWLTPTVLKEGCNVKDMKALAEAPEAYIIYNEADHNEFYMLENRQYKSSDSSLPGHGLLITHIDYDANIWSQNTVNNTSARQRYTIFAADNKLTAPDYTGNGSLDGDPFPGTGGKTKFTNETLPAAKLYRYNSDGTNFMNKPIENITESASGLISFTFNGGAPDGISSPTLTLSDLTPETPVTVYTPGGRRLLRTSYGAFSTRNLPAGIYLLRTAAGTLKVAK